MRTVIRSVVLAAAAMALGSAPAAGQELVKGLKEPFIIKLTSPAFADKAALPKKYTCEGEGVRPPLEWGELPEGTKSLVITIDDGSNRKAFWSQWVGYNLPVGSNALPEGALPPGTREGRSDWNKPGYDPPCPKKGKRDYLITIYALTGPLSDLGQAPSRAEVLNATDGKVLGWGRLFFNYEKQGS
jgi:Raf kinase inhibitor-like YbhB/YbcL family protein